MEEGNLVKWHVSLGDTVESGDVIAEIETDKATMEVEAVEEGEVARILVDEGTENLAVNTMIAVLKEEGDDERAVEAFVNEKSGGASVLSGDSGEADAEQTKAPEPAQDNVSEATAPQSTSAPEKQQQSGHKEDKGQGRIFASPLARRLARSKGLDLASIQGSGPHGRIIKADIKRAEQQPEAAPSAQQAPVPAQEPAGDDNRALVDKLGMAYELVPNSTMRKTIAKRLLESTQTIPHYYLTIECQLDTLLQARKQINAEADGAYKLSVNDFLIKACAQALHNYPRANVAWSEDGLLQFKHADISVAVATDNGLITPIVKQAETKGLREISEEMKDLATRAREGGLKPEEFQGGTFSLSNLGMYGIKQFSAIINPPQSCILAVGAGEEKPYVDNGEVKTGTFMTACLSADHRSVDGAVGAEFLSVLKGYIENPVRMLV
jgi:pyruvate dehydrogenase E2 component (dihydrolipoamide acetyltransferase)